MQQGRHTDAAVLLERARTRMAGLEHVPQSTRDYVGDLIAAACANKAQRMSALCVTPH